MVYAFKFDCSLFRVPFTEKMLLLYAISYISMKSLAYKGRIKKKLLKISTEKHRLRDDKAIQKSD